jgi:WhiB family transcriptional regulator, redox-sensing transcriptional regulator
MTLAINPEPWTEEALCAQVDPELFFPKKGDGLRPAKRICAACPVIGECLGYALRTDQRYGIWGGVTAGKRRKIKEAARG